MTEPSRSAKTWHASNLAQAKAAAKSGGCRLLVGAAVLLLLALAWGCAVNPVTGQSELMLLSEADEIRLGGETAKSVAREYGVYDQPALQRYVAEVARPLAAASHRPQLPWQFQVMDSPVVNAFAAPGGQIFITRGLLAAVNDEAELAGVLAHEIGHVTARHSARNYSQSLLAGIGVQLGTALAGSYGSLVGPLLETGTGLLFLKYSRDDERQADGLAVEYAHKSGYDTNRIADFFTTLQRQESLGGGRSDSLPEWFSTHPSPVDREAAVRRLAADWRARLPGLAAKVNRDGYLDRIDGLVYGDDPREGFREGEWYSLPRRKVEFKIPGGWQFQRAGDRVRLLSPDQRGLVLFAVVSGNTDQVAREQLAALKAVVSRTQRGTVNGMARLQTQATTGQGQQALTVTSSFIQLPGEVLVFHAAAAARHYPDLATVLAQPAASLAPISDPGRLNRQPRRIVVKRLTQPTTFEGALRSYRVKEEEWALIGWLNSLSPGTPLAAGQRLKIIE